jgi:hypothetical protein
LSSLSRFTVPNCCTVPYVVVMLILLESIAAWAVGLRHNVGPTRLAIAEARIRRGRLMLVPPG